MILLICKCLIDLILILIKMVLIFNGLIFDLQIYVFLYDVFKVLKLYIIYFYLNVDFREKFYRLIMYIGYIEYVLVLIL